MWSELKELFATWIAAVSAAIESLLMRIVPQRRILLVEGDDNSFAARLAASAKGAGLPQASFRLAHGRPEPAFSKEWQSALRGCRLAIRMRPDRLLFRTIDFPKAAADFLDGMVRTQIDRLTPWTASDAVFGMTEPEPIGSDRIALTLAATSKQKIEPLLKLAAQLGAASVTCTVEVPTAGTAAEPVTLLSRSLTGGPGGKIEVPRLLRRMLLGTSFAAAASFAIASYAGSLLDTEQQDLQASITQRRAALRINQGNGSAEALLAKRKQTSPASVMVLEAISSVLPDTTYVTELRIEGDKMQVIGLTQDAPSLIKLMEQSPQFTHATFFAPTTRDQNDPGERFHIEAHITPYFGSPS